MVHIPKKVLVTTLLFVFAGLAAGCGENSNSQASNSGADNAAVTANEAASSEAFSTIKWNKYVDAYNKVQFNKPDNNSLVEGIRQKSLAAVKKGDFTQIPSNHAVSGTLQSLEQALKLKGKIEGVDESAKVLFDTITESLPVWKELEEYNKARKYEEDNKAKGKELIVQFNENYAKLEVAFANFGEAVSKQDKIQKEKQLEAYKTSGNLFLYHYNMAFAKAESILDMLGDNPVAAMKNKDTLSKMNAEIKLLEENLDAVKIEIDKAGVNAHYYDDPHGFLLQFVGDYRRARENPEERSINTMIRTYNTAVGSLNQMVPYTVPK